MSLVDRVRATLDPPPENLVFEGGGVWGIAYEGALAELESLGLLTSVRRVAGASAGAITACLLAIGFRPADLGRILRKTDFKSFQDDSFGVVRDTARLLNEFGWYEGDAFREWVRDRMREGFRRIKKEHGVAAPKGKPHFDTLLQWQRDVHAAGGPRLPELFVVGSNLSQQQREVYSAAQSPDLRVEEAVRRSMSIPLYFACARGQERDGLRDVIVDGGLTWNYPVNLFDDASYLDDHPGAAQPIAYTRDPGKHVFNPLTLGFRLDTTKELSLNLKDWSNEPLKVDNIVRYGWALVSFMRAIANKVHLHKNDWTRTVFVDVGEKIAFTDFDLSRADMDFLSTRGREGVRKFLTWRTSEEGRTEVASIYEAMA